MAKKKRATHRLSPAQQHARFVKAATAAEADETPNALEKAFKKIDPRNPEAKSPKR